MGDEPVAGIEFGRRVFPAGARAPPALLSPCFLSVRSVGRLVCAPGQWASRDSRRRPAGLRACRSGVACFAASGLETKGRRSLYSVTAPDNSASCAEGYDEYAEQQSRFGARTTSAPLSLAEMRQKRGRSAVFSRDCTCVWMAWLAVERRVALCVAARRIQCMRCGPPLYGSIRLVNAWICCRASLAPSRSTFIDRSAAMRGNDACIYGTRI